MENVDVSKNSEYLSNLKCKMADMVYDKHYSDLYGIEDCNSKFKHLPTLKQNILLLDLLKNIKYLNFIDENKEGCDKNVINCDLTKIRILN